MTKTISRRTLVKIAGVSATTFAVGGGWLRPGSLIAQGDSPLPTPPPPAPAPTTAPAATAAPRAQSVPLDPQIQAVIDALQALDAPNLTTLTPFNARRGSPFTIAAQTVLTQQNKPPLEPVTDISHRLIPGGANQQMLVRFYQPTGDGPFRGLVYFHGGGFVIANLDTYDASCRALANAANCVVMSVAYRQGPEARFPAAPMDAFAGYRWLIGADNAAAVNVDPAPVAVGGESAGGNLATVTAMMARDRDVALPVHQLLVYPVTNTYLGAPSPNFDSYALFADAAPLATPMLPWFFRNYLRRAADAANPYASPLRGDVEGLPPATVITAEIDPLRDEGEAYAAKLSEAGVAVRATRYDGVTHEFFGLTGIVDKAKQAVAEAAGELKKAFGTA